MKTGWVILSAVQSVKNVDNHLEEGDGEKKKIDLWMKGAPLTMKKPHRYDATFPVFRLRKMLENLFLKT